MELRPRVRTLFPDRVAGAELVDFSQSSALYPEELTLVRNALEPRIAEFRAGRHCVREALRMLGRESVAILAAGRTPKWPAGIVGAITHCDGYCGAVVASSDSTLGIGFDAQAAGTVSPSIWRAIASPSERRCALPRFWWTIAFCAKEAVYKAFCSITENWLGFEDVFIEPWSPGIFRARLERNVSGLGCRGNSMLGSYTQDQGLVFAAIHLSKDFASFVQPSSVTADASTKEAKEPGSG